MNDIPHTSPKQPDRPGGDWKAWAGLSAVLVLPQLPLERWLAHGLEIPDRLAADTISWSLAIALLAWVVAVERRPLVSIGIRRLQWDTLGWAVAMTVALVASIVLSYRLVLPALGLEMNSAAAKSITDLSIFSELALFVRAGVTEELFFRGYPIERLLELTGSKWVAGLVPATLFIATHYWWGAGQMIVVAFGTLIFTLFYLWRRNLLVCIIAHIAADIFGFTASTLGS